MAAPAVSPSARAAIVYNDPADISIPNNIDGIYFNVITGVSGSTGATVTGWDINPYNNGAGLTFYGAATPSGVLASGTPGTTATAQRLTEGTPITSAASFYNQFQTVGTAFQSGGLGYLGLRFINEGTGVLNYGWLEISATSATGFPAFITRYAYENTGASINAGQTAVPEPTTTVALGAMAAGALGLRSWRRRKSAAA